MLRFWRTALPGCLALAAGCSGRTLAGEWQGAVPGFGEVCRIRMDGGSRIAAVCPGPPERRGLGRYRLEGTVFTVEWQTVAENGRSVERPGSFLKARLTGPGNTMRLEPLAGGVPYEWRRIAG